MKSKELIKKAVGYVTFWRGLIAFLLIMLILTMVSRVNDLKQLPQVRTESMKSMSIDHTVTIEGTISNNHKQALFVPKELKIASVDVTEGMYVKKGDELFRIEIPDLVEKLAVAESEARKQELQIQDKQKSNQKERENIQITINRAGKEYEYISSKDNTALMQKAAELNELKDKLKRYESEPLSMRDNTLLKTLENAYAEKKIALAEIINQKEEAISSLQKESSDYNRMLALWEGRTEEANRQFLDAKVAYEAYRDHPMDTDAMKLLYQNLQKEYQEKYIAYTLATLDSNNERNTAQSNLQNANNASLIEENAVAIMQEDLSYLKRRISTLKELKEKNGIIRANADGMILSLGVAAGNITGDTAALLISNQSNGYQFSGFLPIEKSKYVNIGDKTKLTVYRCNVDVSDLLVTSIERLPDNPENYTVLVQIPKKEQELEGNASLIVEKQSEQYPYCVPVDALHSEGAKSFIYLLTEKNTVLGIRSVVLKKEVTVLDKNDSYIAISAEIPFDARVVVSTNKALRNNIRVRCMDE